MSPPRLLAPFFGLLVLATGSPALAAPNASQLCEAEKLVAASRFTQ